MRNKITCITGILIGLLIIIGIMNEVNAVSVYGGVCSSCNGNITLTYYYVDTSTHTVSRACGCSTGAGASPESHKYPSSWNYSDATWHKRACVCGAVQSRAHSGTEATCTTAAYCSTCKSYYGESLGHDYGDYTANGEVGHRRFCSRCNTYSSTEAHDYYSLSASTSTPGYHSRVCKICGYEKDLGKHNMVVYATGKNAAGYYHSLKCDICNNYTEIGIPCTMTSIVTREATCTVAGNRRYTCSVCSQYYDEAIATIAHDWSTWQTNKTEHWKICNYGCGTESSRGTHVDTNPKNGYCDTCNYLMYIIPVASVKGANGSTSTYAVKETETAEFYVTLTEGSEPLSYKWFYKTSSTGASTEISGARDSKYSVSPIENIHAQYYYCIVSNGQYEVTSNRAKLVADVTLPEVTMGSFKDGIIINKTATITIPFIVSDTGEGYTENNNFISDDIVVKVDETVETVTKNLVDKGASGNNHNYELILSNINGDGKLSFEVPANSFQDNFGNQNVLTKFSTNITIDNVAPLIGFESVTGDLNEKYMNTDDTIVIKIAITEAVGINLDELVADDIIVKVAGREANSLLEKKLRYVSKTGDKYIYELTLSNLKGDGILSLNFPTASIKDLATNPNLDTELAVKINGESVVVDNTKPVINDLVLSLGDYNNTSNLYPNSLASIHNGWSNENIYVQINVDNIQEVDYYMKSIGNNENYSIISSYRDLISESIESKIFYRVVDMAGNYAEVSKDFKLDKITPDKPVVSLFEQKQNGAEYIYNPNKPTDKSIYVIPNIATVVDAGNVKSGIQTGVGHTYYIINSYKDLTKTEKIAGPLTFAYNEGFLLEETGYYEIQMTMTDIAGNQIVSDVFKVYINKKAENTIRITKINDIGSGIKKVTIKIFEGDEAGNRTSTEAIDAIVIDNPYKEIIKNVRLGEGTFYVEVTLEDNVGWTTILKKTIVNKL